MTSRKQEILSSMKQIKSQLVNLPPGSIYCTHQGKYDKWYRTLNGKEIYIPKKDKKLAEQLALKKWLTAKLADLENELAGIHCYSKHFDPQSLSSDRILENPSFQKLLSPYFTPESEELAKWSREDYPQNPKYPEHLIHKSISGNMLRSKSEAIIDMLLYQNKLPYRYESPLTLGDITLYPDFTIRHPKTGEYFYYEHFGMMDDPVYIQKYMQKMNLYIQHQIIPSIQLITSYETADHPLTPDTVQNLLNMYFLS